MDFFDNDMACDWENGITISTDISYFLQEFSNILNAKDQELEIDMTCRALAVASAIYQIKTRKCSSDSFTSNVCIWAKENSEKITKELILFAINSLEKIMNSNSELKFYWKLRGNLDDFNNNVYQLKCELKEILTKE